MTSKTKIVVLQLKQLIFSGVLITLGILLLILFLIITKPNDKTAADVSESLYTPGTYTTSLVLNNSAVSISVTVSEQEILSVDMENLDESVAVMYPLMEPSLDVLESQILESQSLENITYPEDRKYTSLVLMNAISEALEHGRLARRESFGGMTPLF